MANKYLRAGKGRVYKVLVPNFSAGVNTAKDARILPLNQAESSFNFCTDTGVLTEGWGLTDTGVSSALCVWQYSRYDADTERAEQIFMYCAIDGAVYYKRPGDAAFTQLAGVAFTSRPFAIGYRLYGEDVVILCSETDRMVVWNGLDAAYSVPSSPYISSLCMHYERLFVTTVGQKNAVWFSDDLDPTNWNPELDEGGFIELMDERGRLNRVLSFNNYVYIFRDYGISRLTAFAEQSGFSTANLFVSSGRIYPDTAVVCGDVILFLAADGFYSFDGLSTHKLLSSLDGLLCRGGKPVACWYGGRYWAAFRAETDETVTDSAANNCMLSFERHGGGCSLMKGADVRALTATADGADETLYAVLGNGKVAKVEKTGKILGTPTVKVWQSGLIDFNSPDRTKRIREIYIDTKYDIKVTVRTEKGEKSFSVKGKPGVSHLRVNLSGTKAGLTVTAEGEKASVARPMILYALSD